MTSRSHRAVRVLVRTAVLVPRRLLALAILVAWASPALALIDTFYLQRLDEGRAALERRDWTRAAEELRTAAFGMLDDPTTLSSTLVLLAIAQAGSGDAAGFRSTFGRLAEVEQAFPVYAQARLAPSERESFESETRRRIPRERLAALPAFEHLAGPDEPSAAASRRGGRRRGAAAAAPDPSPAGPVNAPAQDQRPAAAAAAVPAPPPEARDGAGAGAVPGNDATARVPGTAPGVPGTAPGAGPSGVGDATPPAPASPQAPPQASPATEAPATAATPAARPSGADLARLRQAREQMNAATVLAEMRQALATARGVADAFPAYAPAQLLAGEIAYRGLRWAEAVTFLERANLDGAKQPAHCFYLAVALLESGNRARAAEVITPCVPHLEANDLVTGYLARILPAPAPAPPAPGGGSSPPG